MTGLVLLDLSSSVKIHDTISLGMLLLWIQRKRGHLHCFIHYLWSLLSLANRFQIWQSSKYLDPTILFNLISAGNCCSSIWVTGSYRVIHELISHYRICGCCQYLLMLRQPSPTSLSFMDCTARRCWLRMCKRGWMCKRHLWGDMQYIFLDFGAKPQRDQSSRVAICDICWY